MPFKLQNICFKKAGLFKEMRRTMYRLIFILACLGVQLLTQAQTKGRPQFVEIKGLVTQTADYCGGARPNEEILAELSKPKPLANHIIYVKVGRVNESTKPVYRKIRCDENGRFKIQLRVGTTYSFLDEWKGIPFLAPANTEFVTWDIACLKERFESPEFVLKVKKKNNPLVSIQLHKPCFYKPYCGQYSGPLPP